MALRLQPTRLSVAGISLSSRQAASCTLPFKPLAAITHMADWVHLAGLQVWDLKCEASCKCEAASCWALAGWR